MRTSDMSATKHKVHDMEKVRIGVTTLRTKAEAGDDSQGVAAALVSASQAIGYIIGPAVSTALYEWDESLPFWIITGLMLLLVLKFAIIPLHLPQLGDRERG